jgi:hypothetical protein
MARETHKGNKYRPGDYWRVCDVCGFDMLRSKIRIRWDGLRVCPKDWEEKPERLQPKRIRKERPFRRD